MAVKRDDAWVLTVGDELLRGEIVDSNKSFLSERLLSLVREHRFCRDNHDLRLTASIGGAQRDNEGNPQTGAELLDQADQALYASKDSGRNCVTIYEPDHLDQEELATLSGNHCQ